MTITWCLLALAGGAPAARADFVDGPSAAPDSATLAVLRERLSSHRQVQVLAGGRELVLQGVVPAADGLRYGSRTFREGFTYRTAETTRPETAMVRWSEIATIRTRGSGARNGALLGAAAGLLVGIAVASQQDCQRGFIGFQPSPSCASNRAMPILVGTLAGAGAGALIGNATDPWRPIYSRAP